MFRNVMAMRNLLELGWRPRRDTPFGEVTDENLREFQESFGVVLPPDYVRFLRECNGGRLTARYVNSRGRTLCEMNDVFGLGSRGDARAVREQNRAEWDYGNLWAETPLLRERVPGPVVPIGRDGGDNTLYLDLRRTPAPVWRLVVATRHRYEIARSFDRFVDMLHTDLLG
jgi:hypothetical protein